MIITIDGPAAAGKGTLARRLAAHFDLAHLDTGALYRAVGLRVLRGGVSLSDPAAAAREALALSEADLADPDLRSETAAEAASKVAAMPEVRAALLAFQRHFARHPPVGRGVIVDGRDIGTVVLPDAKFKIFVTASAEARARRRWAEMAAGPERPSLAEIERQVRLRDTRDQERAASPLKHAAGAFLLDTTDLDIDAAFAAARGYISRYN